MRYFITGITGYIGSNLSTSLETSSKNEVFGISSRDAILNKNISYCDMSSADSIKKLLTNIQPDIVIHLAANKDRTEGYNLSSSYFMNNITITENLLEACKEIKSIKKVIISGTAEEYGSQTGPFTEEMPERPITAYSVSKTAIAHICRIYNNYTNIPIIYFRPTICYGNLQNPDMFIPALIQSLHRNIPFKMTSGIQKRDFIHIQDLISAFIKAAETDIPYFEIINIGQGKSFRISNIADTIGLLMNKSDLILKNSLASRKIEILDYSVSIEKAKRVLRWSPRITIENGLKDTISIMEEHEKNTLLF